MTGKVFAFCLGSIITGSLISIMYIIYDVIRRKQNNKKASEKIDDFFTKLKSEVAEEMEEEKENQDGIQ